MNLGRRQSLDQLYDGLNSNTRESVAHPIGSSNISSKIKGSVRGSLSSSGVALVTGLITLIYICITIPPGSPCLTILTCMVKRGRKREIQTLYKNTHIYLLKNLPPAELQTIKNPTQRLPKTAAPSKNVANTLVSIISSALTSIISRSSTTKSALLPTSSEPNVSSVKDA